MSPTHHSNPYPQKMRAAMEASSILTLKTFSSTLEVFPSFKGRSIIFDQKRFSQCSYGTSSSSSAVTRCSLRSDDDREQPKESADWRSFRARLVSSEQASRLAGVADSQGPEPLRPIVDRWAHALHVPEKGCLLVATGKLDGVHIFERTVVLILSTGPLGPTGVILNRPSLMSIKETRSTALDAVGVFSNRPLFFGGPLEEGLFLVSPQGEKDNVGGCGVFEEVMKGVYYGAIKESVGCAAEMVKRNMVGVGEFRFFDGYCGWEKEQLKDEIRAGYWSVVACSPSVIGLDCVGNSGLWEEVVGLVGGRKVW